MKRTKLITNLCLLVLSIACLTFGVYSAVKTSFTAIGTITFNNYGIDADITIDIYGVENGTTVDSTDENYGTVTGLKKRTVLASTGSTATARSAYQANVITTTPTLTLGELKFDELNTTVTEEWTSKIVLVISFTNYSKFDAQLSITQESATITNLTATYGSKIKATESDGSTGVKSTSSLTITLTPTNTSTAVSGTFNPQLSLQPHNIELSDLKKGDLISMELEGIKSVTGMADTYRILNINGNVAEVLAMYSSAPAYTYWENWTTTEDSNGTTVTKYENSDLDNYLNITWYNTLTNEAKTAIVSNDVIQYSYQFNSNVRTSTHLSFFDYSTKSTIGNSFSRYIYALDIEDIEKYFGGTDLDEGIFGESEITNLFWGTVKRSRAIGIRSARADDSNYVTYIDGGVNGHYAIDQDGDFPSLYARPAFKIDLSKIDWA